MLTFEELKELQKEALEIKKMQGDIGLIYFAKKHNDIVTIDLDNDNAKLSFNQVASEEGLTEEEVDSLLDDRIYFENDFGNREGVYTLFEVLGINAEPV